MSDQIKQTFTIDAQQALTALRSLDTEFATLNKRLDETASNIQKFGRTKLDGTIKATAASMDSMSSSSRRLTTSLELLSRVIYTQLIVSAFGGLRRGFADTANAAADFQRAIGLIRTISPDQTVGQIADEVRRLSDSFNIPLLQAADGVYQSLSNQVGTFGESIQFAGEAAQFAKATNSSLADSVDLLSSAMIGFGKGVEDTDKISSIFFTAIDKGRVTASELSNAFGRVNTVAADLGLSLEETAASLASISVRGSKSSEAITQLRAIISGLAKPSQEMQKFLESIGLTSGESAIKILGFAGVLDEMSRAVDEGRTTLSGLLPNVRGFSGAASLTSDELKSLTTNIESMQSAARDFAKNKWLIATANDGEKVRAEINKLKNAITVDLGQSILEGSRQLVNLTGGVDTFIQAIHAAGPAITGMIGTLAALKASSLATAGGFSELGKAIGLLSLVPAAAGLGASIGNFLDDKLTENLLRNLRELEKVDAESLAKFKANQGEKRDAAAQADSDRIRSALVATQEVTKVYNSEIADARTANASLVSNTSDALNSIVGAREKLVAELSRAAGDGARIVEQSAARILALQDRQGDREFDFRTQDLGQAEKVFALAKRSEAIAETASKLLKSSDTKDIERGLALFEKAQSVGEAAAQAAAGDRQLEAKSLKDLRNLTQQQIDAEENLAAVQGRRNAALDQQRDKQQKLTADLKAQAKVLLDNTGLFDQSGQEFSGDQLAQRQKKQQEALKRIAGLALTDQDLTATGALGLAKFIQDSQGELARDPLKLAFDVSQGTADVRAQLTQAFSNFKVKVGIDIDALEGATGQSINNPDQLVKTLTGAGDRAAALRAELDKAAAQDKRIAQIHDEIGTIFAEIDARDQVRQNVPGQLGEQLRADLESLLQQFTAAGADFKVTEEELKKLIEARNQLGQEALGTKTGQLGFSTTVQALDQLILKYQELSQVGTVNVQAIKTELSSLDAIISSLNPAEQFNQAALSLSTANTSVQQMSQSLSQTTTSSQLMAQSIQTADFSTQSLGNSLMLAKLNADSILGSAQATAAAYQAAASAANSITAKGGGGGKQFGGLMLADGGMARGVDTIPAMLQAGEFVVSKQNTQRFYSQLQAINAGQTPVFRQDGGTVNNTTVGDIIVNGAKSPQVTGEEVARAINRSIRRGTARVR